MKNLFWPLILLILASCSRGDLIEVGGKVENGSGMIYLDQQGLLETRAADSAKIREDGGFQLKDRIELPTFYNLHLGDQKIIPLLIQPGETAQLITSSDAFRSDYEITGSPESTLLRDLNHKLAGTNASLDSLRAILNENPDISEEDLADVQQATEKIIDSQRRYSIRFVIENMHSLASIYALYQKLNTGEYVLNSNKDIQLLKITAARLDTIYPESEFVISLKRDAENMVNAYKNQRLKSFLQSAPTSIPEISLPDPGGDTIHLSSLRGNVVILSFWASWNEASVELNQDFKRLYEKYRGMGLEIYQVSFDSTLVDWTQAIRYDELPWINVSELSYPESAVAGLYNVTDIPAFFLIDKSGEIIGKDFERVELDRKIAEIINQN